MNKITELRKAAHLTQLQLSQLSGVHAMTISKLERGVADVSNLRLGTAVALARALGCHAEDLLDDLKED